MTKAENTTKRPSEPPARGTALKPFKSMDSQTFAKTTFSREWIVAGVLVGNQAGVIGGAKKCLKTSLIVDLAISIGTGSPFLGRFEVPRRNRVAVFSGETDQATLQETAKRICGSKSVELSDCSVLWSPQLPRLSDSDQSEALKSFLAQGDCTISHLPHSTFSRY